MKVRVNLGKKVDESYDIVIQNGLSKNLAKQIAKEGYGNNYCIITDSKVKKLFGEKLLKQFKKIKAKAELISFPAGEKNKNLKTVGKILEQMLAKGFDRRCCVVALGGGITGDVAGFVASSYLRGVNFVQVPTSLLAMVDSSIGGKTGVNLSRGKNSVGSFYQPKKVYVCTGYLQGLPVKEIRSGLSEVVKLAIIKDSKFFDYLEKNAEKVLLLDKKVVPEVIKLNCIGKARVVEKDEKEENYRRIVNYGHTIGHAIEIIGNYAEYTHGEAIAIGMVCEAEISRELGMLKEKEVKKIRGLLHKIGLPIMIPKKKKYSLKKILSITSKDKKTISGVVYYSLPEKIGKMHSIKGNFGTKVNSKTVLKVLERCR